MRLSLPTHRLAVAAVIAGGALGLLVGPGSASAAFPGQNGLIVAGKCGNGFGCAAGLNNVITVDPASGAESPITGDLSYEDSDPVVSPDGSRVAFDRWVGSSGHIAAIGIGGGSVDNLTAGPDDEFPAFSPDGSRIVFSRAVAGGGYQLIVMDAGGGNEHQLTSGTASDLSPSWSPDGSTIVFERFESGVGYQLYSVAAGGGTPVLIGSGVDNRFPSFSPDGSHVVFCRLTGSTRSIWVIDAAGGNEHALTAPAAGTQDFYPAYSPDGTQIVFERQTGSPTNTSVLIVMNADGSNQHQVSLPGSYLESPDWQPIQPAAGSGSTASSTSTVDTTPPGLTLAAPKKESVRKGRVYLFATSSKTSTGGASGKVSVAKPAKSYRLRSASKALSANTRTKLSLKMPATTLRAARVALAHHQRAKATVVVRVKDPAGNLTSKRLAIRLTG